MKEWLIDLLLLVVVVDTFIVGADIAAHWSLAMWQCQAGYEVCDTMKIFKRFIRGYEPW